jgi:hypothetical protein
MEDGVVRSRFFLLYLTECVFSRWFCQLEIEKVCAKGTAHCLGTSQRV